MGLITLILLLSFTALSLSKSLTKKPGFVNQVVAKVTTHLDKLSLWGSGYAVVSAIIFIAIYGGGSMFVRLFADMLIILMALPFVLEQLLPKFQEKLNPVIIEELKHVVGWVTKQDKYIGYAGAIISLLLFAVLFR
ncbi:MAG: hypothetical protein HY052_06945 [Proteobacteria bacterium]|nr:hypothetical protein [Pseudomonadota bacterium]